MSLISGSNSLAPAIAGALDLRGVIVEKAFLEEAMGRDAEVCSKCDVVYIRVFPFEQREKDVCCCSGRMAVRLMVLSRDGMPNSFTILQKGLKDRASSKTIDIHMRLARPKVLVPQQLLEGTTQLCAE